MEILFASLSRSVPGIFGEEGRREEELGRLGSRRWGFGFRRFRASEPSGLEALRSFCFERGAGVRVKP